MPPSSDEEQEIASKLAAYGDRFLAMFEDADERAAAAAQTVSSLSSEDDDGTGSEFGDSDDDLLDERVKVSPAPQAVSWQATIAPPRPHIEDRERYAAERKAFMSGKIGASKATPLPGKRVKGTAPTDDPRSKAEFIKMQREVLKLGAGGLDKKARRLFDAGTLARLGSKVEKGPRVPASIGLGMAKKQAQREARATEEAIAAGMLNAQNLAKKRRREASAARPRDVGLREEGGKFRPGVLHVGKPPPVIKKKGGRR